MTKILFAIFQLAIGEDGADVNPNVRAIRS
jgi:hypothetical protein